MKKTMTIILLSVAVIALGGWIVWQQQTIEKAEKTRQQESKTSDLKFKKLTSDQTDMKHKNDEQKKQIANVTKKLKKEKQAYEKEVKQRKALEVKIDQLQKELAAAKATAQANKQTTQSTRKPTVKKDPNVTHHPPSQWVQDQYDWGVKQGYIKE